MRIKSSGRGEIGHQGEPEPHLTGARKSWERPGKGGSTAAPWGNSGAPVRENEREKSEKRGDTGLH
jgi:hypothetical protein